METGRVTDLHLTRKCFVAGRWCIGIAFVFLLSSRLTLAQTSASLSGTVLDPSGAAVPAATVTIRNQNSNDTRTTTSNNAGFFTFASLSVGTYTVDISAAGFSAWERKDVSLNAGDQRTLTDISLQLGAGNTAVTVTAESAAVPTDNGTRSALISSQEIEKLSTIGRDATELLGILPGMSVSSSGGVSLTNSSGYDATVTGIGSTAIGNFTSNGGEPNGSTQTFLDGASIIDPGNMGAGTQTLDMDMVSQVNVQTSAFGANSPGGPTIISAIGKSGTSTFHGEAYLYARNQYFNANSWGDNQTGTRKPPGSYYYPGGNVGGPILIPKTHFNKNKTLLFFAGYENYQQSFPGPLLETIVPTTGMRNGDFSPASLASICPAGSTAAYCQPITGVYAGLSGTQAALNGKPITLPSGAPITGNQIPASAIDPGGAAIMKFIAAPNATYSAGSPYNYVQQLNYFQNGWIFHGRVDYSVGNNDKVFVTYNQQGEQDINQVNEYWTPSNSAAYPSPITANDTSRTIALNYVHIFGASLTNEAIATYSYFLQPWVLENPSAVSRSTYGYPYSGYFHNNSVQMPSLVDWSNYGYPQYYMEGGFENGAVLAKKVTPTFADNLTWVKGTHTMMFGYYFMHSANKQTSTGQWSQGSLTFGNSGSWSTAGSPVYPGTGNPLANILLGLPTAFTQSNYIPVTDLFYRVNAFYLQDSWRTLKRLTLNYGVRFDHIGPWLNAYPGGMAVFDPSAYTNNAVSGEFPGITWHGINSSVPSSGIYNYPWAFVSPRVGIAWDIFGNGHTVLRGGWGRYRYQDQYNEWAGAVTETQGQVTRTNPSPQTLAQIDAFQFSGSQPLSPGALGNVFVVDPKDNTRPLNDNYNVTISQRGPMNSVAELAYVGGRTRFMNNTENYLASNNNYALANINLIGPGALFRPDPITGAPANPAGAVTADYRPYPLYNEIVMLNNNLWSNYNALQASVAKQAGRVNFQFGYTFSKTLGINSANDPFDFKNDYGVMGYDRTHTFNSAYSFDTGRWLHRTGVVGGVLNGWLLSGITTWQSGVPVNGAANTNYSITGLGTFNLSNQVVLGTPDVALVPLLVCSPTSNLGPHQYINGSCFVAPSTGSNGTFEDPYINSPSYFRTDLSLQKNIVIRERNTIQLRFSAFNFLNHPLWTFNPNNNADLVLQYNAPAAGQLATNANSQFGILNFKSSPLGSSAPNRVVEFTLKYMF